MIQNFFSKSFGGVSSLTTTSNFDSIPVDEISDADEVITESDDDLQIEEVNK